VRSASEFLWLGGPQRLLRKPKSKQGTGDQKVRFKEVAFTSINLRLNGGEQGVSGKGV